MKPRLFLLVLLLIFAQACSLPAPQAVRQIPTFAATATVLPTIPPTPTASATPPPPPTLRQYAQGHGLRIGVATDPAYFLKDDRYVELVSREFDVVTPENVMKFEVIHPEPGRYDFTRADQVVSFAEKHGMAVRGHTLVWDSQLPEWVVKGQRSREEWLGLLKDHIQAVVGHYRGRVYAWDVVNEPFDDEGRLRNTIWMQAIGPEYIALAFQWAREADPDALLFLNENGGEGLNRKSQAVWALAVGLLEAGVPLDGIGMQMHTVLGSTPSQEDLLSNFRRLGELGLQVQITEMDVRLQFSTETMEKRLAGQAEAYRRVMAACLEAGNCTAFVTWGLSDNQSWIPPLTGKDDWPLLFDESYLPKPAYRAVLDELRK